MSQGLGAGRVVQEYPVPIDVDDDVKPLCQSIEGSQNSICDGSLVAAHQMFLDRFLSHLICGQAGHSLLAWAVVDNC